MNNTAFFDEHADYFLQHIYASDKGQIRLAVLQADLRPFLQNGHNAPLKILDVGGGGGQMACWAASLGHQVSLLDRSAALLQHAEAQARAQGLELRLIHADLHDFLNADTASGAYDVIFCHAVLEWLADAKHIVQRLPHLLRSSGIASLLYYNRYGQIFTQHVYGNFDYLDAGLPQRPSAKMTPSNPIAPADWQAWMDALPWRLHSRSGVRCFYDCMKARDRERHSLEEIIQRELALRQQEPYLFLARYLHEVWRTC